MRRFMELYAKKVTGAISGWDRIRFRGTVRWLASLRGLGAYMGTQSILLKDFGAWAEKITGRIRSVCEEQAARLGVPMIYLRSSSVDKETLARKIAEERGIQTGSICMFSVVETCVAPMVRGNRTEKKVELQFGPRKCVWIYHYWNDPEMGFGHTRLQTWLPLSVTVCLNGRHWLERQLMREGLDYVKDGNSFSFIQDMARAQERLNQQQQTNWPERLNALLEQNCPTIRNVMGSHALDYYWSADETEWATDIFFRSTDDLNQLYPQLLRFGMVSAQSPAVMRFLGRRSAAGALPEEVKSDLRTRYEGVRLKHWVNHNSIKMYNKAGNLLRVETTINQTRDFKVFRCPDDDQTRPASWQKMRKGVSDLHRRGEVSQACNERYLDHLAASSLHETLMQTAADICNPVIKKSRRYRAINPWNPGDFALLEFMARGEVNINGFRNRDLRAVLYPDSIRDVPLAQKRTSARVSRRLAMLRAHGLVKKVSKTNRYLLTDKGRNVVTAILAASHADTEQLINMAA